MRQSEKLELPASIGVTNMSEFSNENRDILELLRTTQDFDAVSILLYFELIKKYNTQRISEIQELLIPVFTEYFVSDTTQVSILTPGSDGKLEKGPFLRDMYSPLEFLVMYTGVDITSLATALLSFSETEAHLDIDKRLELKDLDSHTAVISGFKGDERHAWPDRVVNALCMAGSVELHHASKERVYAEWHENPRIRKCVKDYASQFFKTSLTGKSRKIRHFNPRTGSIFYDKDKYILGLKYGPIRALQLFLMKYQLKNNAVSPHTNTIDTLHYLFGNEQIVTDAATAYMQALRIYHWQQFQAKSGKDASIQLLPSQISLVVDPVVEFISAQK